MNLSLGLASVKADFRRNQLNLVRLKALREIHRNSDRLLVGTLWTPAKWSRLATSRRGPLEYVLAARTPLSALPSPRHPQSTKYRSAASARFFGYALYLGA